MKQKTKNLPKVIRPWEGLKNPALRGINTQGLLKTQKRKRPQ